MSKTIYEKDSRLYHLGYPLGAVLSESLNTLKSMAKIVNAEFSKSKLNRMNIFCMGSSGAITAAIILNEISKENNDIYIIHVKKDGEKSHSSRVDCKNNAFNIIVDDFVESGKTIEKVYKNAIRRSNVSKIDLVIFSGDVTQDFADWIDWDKPLISKVISKY
ncbi:phosphoribosyltransferase [Cellulophaga phage Calle_1]|uniref:Phosphoribosyltransferase n=1 Tax=Cellulophaga phage Calle_1 TaxID=2745643 RepID=A0A8E5E914_9CAUD|nr:phosphoribosyltransferase [Cellulophaga phage Calle_1]QQV89768.1 phosphoribosyltransferase [Cellulophaga phage Calle_1]QQV89821.1 phosphoribosyltransferase [Cellulophaga phage Calle_2]QQV89898.1 phosphoribosyltransferase [Cellulophaga phage Calle_3]